MPTWMDIIAALAKIAIMVGFLVNVAGFLTWVDRRLSSMIQDRIGPNRAGITIGKFKFRVLGLLHTAADGVKFFFKEDFMPPGADKLLFSLAPMLVMIPVLVLVAVIPMGDTISVAELSGNRCWQEGTRHWFLGGTPMPGADAFPNAAGECVKGVLGTAWFVASRTATNTSKGIIDLAIAPLDSGVLFVFAIAGQGVVGAAIAGWSSDNKFSLMGALRAASQMVSYEVGIGLSLVGAMMMYGTVRLDDMVRWQGNNTWGIFVQPLGFILFFISAVAESKRIPFDLPEAESELVSGYFTEYSGMKFAMFMFSEYMEIITSSMLLVTIFLGGWQLPFFHRDGVTVAIGESTLFAQRLPHIWVIIFGVVAFFGKTMLVCLFQAVVRWSLPRFRYDQLMKIGWRGLLPLSLANIAVTGVAWMGVQQMGPEFDKTLKLIADCTQGLVAAGGAVFVVWLFSGLFFGERTRLQTIIGSTANQAFKKGGTRTEAMQG